MYQYPYGNAQQLNLDWILNKLKEIDTSSGATLEEVSNALIALNYAEQNYNLSDIVFHNGKLYSANQNITAEPWNPDHWNEVLLANPVSNLVRYVSALNNSQVYNTSNVAGTHTSDALNNIAFDIADEAKTRGILGAKNFVKQEVLIANAENGITSTVNADGTLTISGTATNSYTFGLFQPPYIILPDGEYIASVGQNLTIRCLGFNGSSWVELAAGLGEQTFTATGAYTRYQFQVRFVTGETYSGKLYPMIRLSTDIDATFQKYSPTNAELNGAINAITPLDTTPTSGSTKGITSGAVYTGLSGKQNSLSTQTGTVTSAGVLPLDGILCKKYGNVVFLYMASGATAVAMTTNYTTIATLPVGYRPTSTMIKMDIIYGNDGRNRTECVTSIDNAGAVKIACPANENYAFLRLYATFIVD